MLTSRSSSARSFGFLLVFPSRRSLFCTCVRLLRNDHWGHHRYELDTRLADYKCWLGFRAARLGVPWQPSCGPQTFNTVSLVSRQAAYSAESVRASGCQHYELVRPFGFSRDTPRAQRGTPFARSFMLGHFALHALAERQQFTTKIMALDDTKWCGPTTVHMQPCH